MNRIVVLAAVVVVIIVAMVLLPFGKADATGNGNNGTIKIHEQGTPDGTESNDPKVCTFNVEGFGFDANQPFQIRGEVQGGDGPTGTNFTIIPDVTADANGLFASAYVTPNDGHYKVTAFGKDTNGGYTLEKSKSKVIKVECEPTTNPPTPTETPSVTPPVTPETPTATPTVPTETPTVNVPTETPTVPTETPTGPSETPQTNEPDQTPNTNGSTPTRAPEPTKAPVRNNTVPPKNVQVIACVDGVWVTTVNGKVIAKAGTCEVTPENATPQTFSETGL